MKFFSKVAFLLFLAPASLLAQPGVRMSSDFLPLEVGNRWVYDLFTESGQKIGSVEFAVRDYGIIGGRSFYSLTQFPFAEDGNLIKLVRYDRQERTYMKMVDSEEGPLFLADGARAEVLQADESGLPVKFILHGDLVDLTFQRGQGIVEARMHSGKDIQIARLTALHTGERKAVEARTEGAPAVPQPQTPEQKTKALAESVAKPSADTVALDVQVAEVPGGMKFVLTVINSTDKLVPFSFNSSETYDFAVLDASTGQEVWRWSRRQFFTPVVRQEALRPNRNWIFEVTWNRRDNDLNVLPPGKYKVVGDIASKTPMESDPAAFDIK